jgi:hypothetical protein
MGARAIERPLALRAPVALALLVLARTPAGVAVWTLRSLGELILSLVTVRGRSAVPVAPPAPPFRVGVHSEAPRRKRLRRVSFG